VVPILAKELPLMREQLPGLLLKAQAVLAPRLKELGIEMALDPASLKAFIIKYFNTSVEDSLDGWLTSLRIGGSVALAVVGNVILIPVALFYLLADWDRFVAHVVGLVPQRMRPGFDGFVAEVDEVLGQYLRGQLTVMVSWRFFTAQVWHCLVWIWPCPLGFSVAWPWSSLIWASGWVWCWPCWLACCSLRLGRPP